MDKKVIAVILLSLFVFTACSNNTVSSSRQAKNTSNGVVSGNKNINGDSKNSAEDKNLLNKEVTGKDKAAGTAEKNNSVKNGGTSAGSKSSVPKLSDAQRKQVDQNVGAVVEALDGILKSIQEPKELDMNGV